MNLVESIATPFFRAISACIFCRFLVNPGGNIFIIACVYSARFTWRAWALIILASLKKPGIGARGGRADVVQEEHGQALPHI